MTMKKLLLTVAVSIGLTASTMAQVPSYVPTTGLVGWWPFNGNANDESGNGNNGSPGSGVTLTTDRFLTTNAAYDFNGSGNISLTSIPTVGSQDFTISGWVKTNNTSVRKGIACWGQDNPWNSTYFYITDNGYLKFDFAYNGGPQSPVFIADNNWHSVSITCTSGLVQLYLDGIATGTTLLMSPNISGSNKALGANIDNSGSNNFVGKLDDFGIWNRALTQQEITNLYNASLPTNCLPAYVPITGLVGWWPFCGNANDESGNGNNGTTGSGVTLTTDRFFSSNAAYDFNGSGNISLTSLPTTGPQDFTISGWIKTNNTTVRKGIACWGQDNPWQSTYFFVTNTGYLNFGFAYNGGPQSSTFIADNQWHHVAVTCISGLVQLYLDGLPTATALQMNPNISGANKALGANIDNSGSNNFVGSLDDIGIWNRALTQQEITDLYNSSTLGISEVTQINLFSVFPNPAQSVINVKADSKLIGSIYTIYENTGKVVLTGKLNSNNTTIELGNLSDGIYIFRVGETIKQTLKVIKQ